MPEILDRVIITRTDKLGDFMLTWPALADARAALPAARVDVLVSPAVEEIARACPYVDEVMVDRGGPPQQLRNQLRAGNYDAAVALFSNARVAWALWGARVPYRLAPATKLHQLFFNHRLKQRRSQSLKPEYEYNRDLIRQLLVDHGVAMPEPAPQPPFWMLSPKGIGQATAQLRAAYAISDEAWLVIIHPGSGGSARNLALSQYAELANRLKSDHPLFVLVTAGPGEVEQANALAEMITVHKAAAYASTDGLVAFAQVLAQAALFVSGSTGPLHIAGALDVPTLAFYPRRRSSTALRWQTSNRAEHRLAFSPPPDADEQDMQAIDVAHASQAASHQFLGERDGD
jgi:ADP-heptose:LPS heptosyltransferase